MADQSRREFLRTLGEVTLGAGMAGFALPRLALGAGGEQRNVLFILSDQHSARALGCYGNPQVKTPNLDRLASQGALFERAFCTSPQCKPSRYSIWTGRYVRSHGTYNNSQLENDDEITIADVLGGDGYRAASIGKHHMQMDEVADRHGFQFVVDMRDYLAFARATGAPRLAEDGEWMDGRVRPGASPVGISATTNEQHTQGFWTRRAIEFMQRNRERPFFLWLGYKGPHTPIVPSQPWATMYDPASLELPPNHEYAYDAGVPGLDRVQLKPGSQLSADTHRQVLAYYYGLVSQLDHNVGLALEALDELGIAERTVVVYASDHGEFMSEHGAWTKGRFGYDALLRVPLILRSPGQIPAGRRVTKLVSLIDVFPTLMDLVDQPTPAAVQGRSLVPLLGNGSPAWRDAVFAEIGNPRKYVALAVREKDAKYVVYRRKEGIDHEQLYDLESDPWEMQNLAGDPKRADQIEALRKSLAAWESETQAVPPPPLKVKRVL